MSSNTNAVSQQWATYVDLTNDVVPWLQLDPADDSYTVRLQMVIDYACAWVQNFLSRPIAPTTFHQRFDGWTGWNGAYIELPWYPVLEVIAVVEYRGIAGPFVLPESTPASQVDGFQLRPLTGRLTRVFPGNVQKPWFPGSANVEVEWTAGFQPVPPDIKLATLELVAYWWRNTQQQSAVRGAGGATSSEYDPAEPSGLWAGVPNRLMDIFTPYLHVGIG